VQRSKLSTKRICIVILLNNSTRLIYLLQRPTDSRKSRLSMLKSVGSERIILVSRSRLKLIFIHQENRLEVEFSKQYIIIELPTIKILLLT